MTDVSQAPPEGPVEAGPVDNSPAPGPAEGNSQPPQSGAISLAVEIGWTMAVLFGTLRDRPNQPAVTDRLPTEHELAPADRRDLEDKRVNTLLARLGEQLPGSPGPQQDVPQVRLLEAAVVPDATSDQEVLAQRNLDILEWLASAGRDYGVAYQLGRALRDTADPPVPAGGAVRDVLLTQFSRARVSRIQEWLSTVQPYLPQNSAAIVSRSIGRWSDLVATIFDKSAPGRLRRFGGQTEPDVADKLAGSLLPQGDAWINLLTGAKSAQGLLTPEGYVAAGEAALSRSARIVKRIAAHYWFLLVILAIALGAVLYFAASGIRGAGLAWTQIALVTSALGTAIRGLTTAVGRFSGQAERPVFGLEEIDAMAWAVTTFPTPLKLDAAGVRALRRAGIPPAGPMGRT
jgi:hypothetical protein